MLLCFAHSRVKNENWWGILIKAFKKLITLGDLKNNNNNHEHFFQTNAVLLALVIHEFLKMQSNKAPNAEKLRQAAKAFVVLSPLLGVTWAFGILSVTNAGLVFQYIFIVLNSLQVT